ncbi:MAG: TonB-dependent receptor [Sphingomonas bacterium]|uniref:TonB-dependent receptor domain-containing protein n=1 Tax=Sphingomonas bacterium TaxID=1895847 RepID=UPI002624ED05|nr:TonB-dependent receptor [Sphingomonas bacterium]MDB5704505.1 TonB-dependent receptor [Sphingomonas bacterium]
MTMLNRGPLGNRFVPLLRGTAMTAVLLTICASEAQAQVAPQSPAPLTARTDSDRALPRPTQHAGGQADPAPSGGSAGQSGAGDIVVTGSRVSNPNVSSPTPVTSVSGGDLQKATPSNISDALNQLPAFRGSNSARTTNTGASPAQGNYLNLRNIGVNRTLVLYDGLRILPTNATGGVDTNALPQLLVDRVDVVTGGASAAYGSDAVAGVVNFRLNKNFKGLKAFAQSGISDYGDVASYRFGLAAGTSFADDRLHVEASFEHYHVDPLSPSQRPNYDKYYSFTGTGTAANPYVLNSNTNFNTVTAGGIIKGGPLNNIVFLGNDQTKVYSGTATGTTNIGVGGDGLPWRGSSALAGLRTDQAFGRLQYDFSPALRFHAQYSWAESENQAINVSDYRFPGSGAQITLFSGNPYLPTSVQAAMTAQNIPSIVVGRASLEELPFTIDVTNDVGILNFGFDGKFNIGSKSVSWDVSYTHERSAARNVGRDSSNVRFAAAADAVRDPSGNIVCRVTITNPGLYPGCVPANIVGPGSLSPAAVDYVRNITHWAILNKLDIVAANVRADLFDLPGGPLSVAVGGEARWQALAQTSDSDPAIPIASISTGVRGILPSTTINRTTIAGTAAGTLNVKEAYGEIAAPLLRDLPLINALDLNGAVRYTDYSTSGSVVTWKLGGVYKPVGDLLLRATLSRDIAAPTLFQLYSGTQVVTGALIDPHTGLSTQALQITRGNSSLIPERATTKTFGGVYTPSWLRGFNFSVDYYNIKIKDAIITRSGAQELADCEVSGGTAPICAFIVRPLPFSDRTAANAVTAINIVPVNLASFQQVGIDFQSNYNTRLNGIGDNARLILRADANLLLHVRTQLTATSPTLEAAGRTAANQRLRMRFSEGFQTDRFSVELAQRYIGGSALAAPQVVPLVFADYNASVYKPIMYLDFNGTVTVGAAKKFQLFLNVQNLLNRGAPINGPVSGDLPTANPGFFLPAGFQYDVVGRYFTAGVRVSF